MRNYYITRDDNENIISTFARPQHEGQEVLSENDQEIIDYFSIRETIDELKNARITEIKVEREKSILKGLSFDQAGAEIDEIFNGATTIALLRAACIQAFKMILPYILR